MKFKILILSVLNIFLFANLLSANDEAGDLYIQNPKLLVPEKGHLSGSDFSQNADFVNLAKGDFDIKMPINFPQDRGRLLYNLTPHYSPSQGISEWGLGVKVDLNVTRWRERGEIEFNDNDKLQSPFGILAKGNDGYWYDQSLQHKVKASLNKSRLEIYLPDTTKLTFGANRFIFSDRGIYSWYLVKAENVDGTKNEFIYDQDASGYLYLKEVYYGGKNNYPLYKISYTYGDNLVPFVDYRSSDKTVLSKKIKKIDHYSKNLGTGNFDLNFSYSFFFLDDRYSPVYFLTRITKIYSSGKSDPIFKMNYNSPDLNQFDWVKTQKYDEIVSLYGQAIFSPRRATYYDANNDGILDFEDYQSYHTIISDLNSPKVESADSDKNNLCYEQSFVRKRPRYILKVDETKDTYKVLRMNNSTYSTDLLICDKLGNIEYEQDFPGTWVLGRDTKIIDLNKDLLPDIIKISGNNYKIIMNKSNSEGYAFEEVKTGKIFGNESTSGVWLYDINGDGLLDIVARRISSLGVWYGKGNFDFEQEATIYKIYNKNESIVGTIANATVLFEDFNKDGLADLFLVYPEKVYIYINTGNNVFQEVEPEKLSFLQQFLRKSLSTYDLLSNGSSQVAAVINEKDVYSLQLNHAGTMLLKQIDDGKGNQLTFS
ncbi:MAG: VCBS repeat-containing protein, partial [Oligoflexia bacterium]|nr:VCBS repeat-containing protein [Oligoflexia bacterium]